MGLMIGALAIKVWKLALFCIGAGAGFCLWITFKALFPDVLETDAELYGVLAGICIILGLVALKLEKVWLIVGTPIVGAFMFIQGIDHFISEDFNVWDILVQQKAGCGTDECYAVYGLFFGASILGFLVQVFLTSEYAKERRKKEKRE